MAFRVGIWVRKGTLFLILFVLSACSLFPAPEIEIVPTISLPVDSTITPVPPTKAPVPTLTHTSTMQPDEPPVKEPTATAAATVTQSPANPQVVEMPFHPQMGSPSYIPSFMHQEQGCAWVGIAGQVFDPQGDGLENVAILVTRMDGGQEVILAGLTAAESSYGPGGYEIQLSDRPAQPGQTVAVQLYNLESQPISDPLPVRLPDRCEQNLVLVNFQSSYLPSFIYLPLLQSER
jgi:hypothetical protein